MPERYKGTITLFWLARGIDPEREEDSKLIVKLYPIAATNGYPWPLEIHHSVVDQLIDNGFVPEVGNEVEVEMDHVDDFISRDLIERDVYNLYHVDPFPDMDSEGDTARDENVGGTTDNAAPRINGHGPEGEGQNGHADPTAPQTNGNVSGGEHGRTRNGA